MSLTAMSSVMDCVEEINGAFYRKMYAFNEVKDLPQPVEILIVRRSYRLR